MDGVFDDIRGDFHGDFHAELRSLQWELAAVRVTLEAQRTIHAFIKAGYKPEQPRVPRGQTGGGQWTGGAGSVSRTPYIRPTPDKPYPDAIEPVYPIEGLLLFALGGEIAVGARALYAGVRTLRDIAHIRRENSHYAREISKGHAFN